MKLGSIRKVLQKRVHQKGHWNDKVLPKPRSSAKLQIHLRVYSIGFDSADSFFDKRESPVTISFCRKQCDQPFMFVMAGVLPACAAKSGE